MKCKYCDRDAAYTTRRLCHTHYNKYKYRVPRALPVKDLRTDYRRVSATNCKRCGNPRHPGTTNVLCYECLLAYNKVVNKRRSDKHKKYLKDYYIENKPTIQEYKRNWWKNKHNRDLIVARQKSETV